MIAAADRMALVLVLSGGATDRGTAAIGRFETCPAITMSRAVAGSHRTASGHDFSVSLPAGCELAPESERRFVHGG